MTEIKSECIADYLQLVPKVSTHHSDVESVSLPFDLEIALSRVSAEVMA
jgi:hypothetical protein